MEWIAEKLTDYIIAKGEADAGERELYEYGFVIALEKGICIIICSLLSIFIHMEVEGILFFVIFIPLRSYAGGLHMNKFLSCLVLSCSAFLAILLFVKFMDLPVIVSLVIVIICECIIWFSRPVDNLNRIVEDDENRYFINKLKCFLLCNVLLSVIFLFLKESSFLFLIALTLVLVVSTMLIEKMRVFLKELSHRCV